MGSRAAQEQRDGRGSSPPPGSCAVSGAPCFAAFARVSWGQERTEASGGSVSMCVTPGGWGRGGGGQGDLVLLWRELWVLQICEL